MGRARKAALAGVGVAGAAAALLSRRARPAGSGGAGGGRTGTSRTSRASEAAGTAVVTATILRPVDEVTMAWAAADDAGDESGGPAGDRPVSVEFGAAPGGRGTEVRAQAGPSDGGDPGVLTRLRGETPAQRQRERLRRFKALAECGEVVTVEGQPSGRGPAQEAVTQAVTRRLRAWSGQ